MKKLYLIKRGVRGSHHRAPYHGRIICDRKEIADWEAGWTGDFAWVWEKDDWGDNGYGWLIKRWAGLVVDYGHLVRHCELPDGTHVGFWRDYDAYPKGLKGIIDGATWWSDRPLPDFLAERGVWYPRDNFSQQRILDAVANDGVKGSGREIPSHFPDPRPVLEHVAAITNAKGSWQPYTLADALIESGVAYDRILALDLQDLKIAGVQRLKLHWYGDLLPWLMDR